MSNADCNDPLDPDATAVLEFWFGDPRDPDNARKRGRFWFAPTSAEDLSLRERFADLHETARRGGLDHWTAGPRGTLALILLLDQFTRSLYRGTASAFADDARALIVSREGMARGFDADLGVVERAFWYMPFQHAEDLAVQRESTALYRTLLAQSPAPFREFSANAYDFAVLHCEIIERFGRFPHRNDLLGRPSTVEEKAYLDNGGHRFGQG